MKTHTIPSMIAAALLLWALADHQYGYYIFLRLAVTGAAVFVAISFAKTRFSFASYIFGLIGLLFNPIIPVHLTKSIWQPIDVSVAVLFIASIFFPKGK